MSSAMVDRSAINAVNAMEAFRRRASRRAPILNFIEPRRGAIARTGTDSGSARASASHRRASVLAIKNRQGDF